jgi:hypothetical protein
VADDDGADGVDCIEFRRSDDSPAHRPHMLALASAACGEPIDGAWVVRYTDGHAAAAVAAQLRSDHIAFVDLSAPAPDGAGAWAPGLLHRALTFCHDGGALKLVINTDGLPAASVRALAESRGFQFARARSVDGADVIEFYTNLYHRDETMAARRL